MGQSFRSLEYRLKSNCTINSKEYNAAHRHSTNETIVNYLPHEQLAMENLRTFCQEHNIDINATLDRIGNSTPLYLEITRSFISDLQRYKQQLDEMDIGDNRQQLQFVFHTLKGTSSTLGFTDIAEFSVEIEEKLKQEKNVIQLDIKNRFSRLFSSHQLILNELIILLIAANSKPKAKAATSTKFDIKKELDSLASLLSTFNMRARKQFDIIADALALLDNEQTKLLAQAISELEFNAALVHANTLQEKI